MPTAVWTEPYGAITHGVWCADCSLPSASGAAVVAGTALTVILSVSVTVCARCGRIATRRYAGLPGEDAAV